MPCDNAGGAIKLFREHRAHEHMGPGGFAKRQQKRRACTFIRAQAVSGTNQEATFAGAGIPPHFELTGQISGTKLLPGFVKRRAEVRILNTVRELKARAEA